MSSNSSIEWTDATWNPIVGCSVLSPGCTNCYAMKMAARIERMNVKTRYAGTTQQSKGGAVWTGKVVLAPDHIVAAPLRWRKPRKIFVNSMGDLFHEAIPDEWIDKVFTVMALCPQHIFQVLTKRAERMRAYISQFDQRGRYVCSSTRERVGHDPRDGNRFLLLEEGQNWPLNNVWLGISCERQEEADERIPPLLQMSTAVRFVSCEPLLGPINLRRIAHGGVFSDQHHADKRPWIDALDGWIFGDRDFEYGRGPLIVGDDGRQPRLHWVIVGGESGPKARPMWSQWAIGLRDQCHAADVAFFYKQNGEFIIERDTDGTLGPVRVGKKAAGRLLDGREWNEMPTLP